MAENRVDEQCWEFGGQFVFHEYLLLPIADRFNYGVRLENLNETVAATRKAICEEHPDLFPDGVVVSAQLPADETRTSGTLEI